MCKPGCLRASQSAIVSLLTSEESNKDLKKEKEMKIVERKGRGIKGGRGWRRVVHTEQRHPQNSFLTNPVCKKDFSEHDMKLCKLYLEHFID